MKCMICKKKVEEREKLVGTRIKKIGKKEYIILCAHCQGKIRKKTGDRRFKKFILDQFG